MPAGNELQINLAVLRYFAYSETQTPKALPNHQGGNTSQNLNFGVGIAGRQGKGKESKGNREKMGMEILRDKKTQIWSILILGAFVPTP